MTNKKKPDLDRLVTTDDVVNATIAFVVVIMLGLVIGFTFLI